MRDLLEAEELEAIHRGMSVAGYKLWRTREYLSMRCGNDGACFCRNKIKSAPVFTSGDSNIAHWYRMIGQVLVKEDE